MRAGVSIAKGTWLAMLATAIAALGILAPSASAHTGEYARFNNCPSTTPGVSTCIYSVTTGGKVVLGKKTVPIVNPVTLQGGLSEENAKGEQKFFAASNGVTLSKTPQPVPGGLAGLVNCKEISNFLERIACEGVFENGLTGVNSTLELAAPASEIGFSELAVVAREGVGLRLPVKVHLENPLLGSTCYVGSSSHPLIWNLTTGKLAAVPPNPAIEGKSGKIKAIEGGEILELEGTELVDNAWSAPGASGCGGPIIELILDPILDSQVGVPAASGHNLSILQNNTYLAFAETVNEH